MQVSDLHVGDLVVTTAPWSFSRIWEVTRIQQGQSWSCAYVVPVYNFNPDPQQYEKPKVWETWFNVDELRPAVEIADNIIKVWEEIKRKARFPQKEG